MNFCGENIAGQMNLVIINWVTHLLSGSHRVVHHNSEASGKLVAMTNRRRLLNVKKSKQRESWSRHEPNIFSSWWSEGEDKWKCHHFVPYNAARDFAVSKGSSPAANGHADDKHGKPNKQSHPPCCFKVSGRWGFPTGCSRLGWAFSGQSLRQ